MRRDIVTGTILSFLIHSGCVVISQIYKDGPPTRLVQAEMVIADPFPQPPLDEEKPRPEESKDPEPAPDFTVPIQNELIAVPQPDSFLQLAQAPVPEGPRVGTINIPTGPRGPGGPGGLEIFNPDKLDQQPRPTFQAKPSYPTEQRRTGITGQVVVGFVVDAAGNVQGAYAISSTQREFEAAAVQAVGKWKFKPGRRGGSAVATRMQVPMVFSISNDL